MSASGLVLKHFKKYLEIQETGTRYTRSYQKIPLQIFTLQLLLLALPPLETWTKYFFQNPL